MGRLAGLARRAKKQGHIEAWVPESVLWEWTEHMHSDLPSTEKALNDLRKTGRTIPALTTPPVSEIEDDLRKQLAHIGPPLKVLSVSDVAGQALGDQLLLLGPAKAKPARDGSVKTGGADRAHLRAFEVAASGDTATYGVVSSDGVRTKELQGPCAAKPPLPVRNRLIAALTQGTVVVEAAAPGSPTRWPRPRTSRRSRPRVRTAGR
jgi:hypothetical protein